ncbi:universal stress protein [Sungkyunkwania multivorans]|uniref:Universal stress protein n=1 Tax=Sungkyunkwania multivorans TaxID=1173618 RepID=A0ABW3D1V4_9FLAO
MRRILLPTDFSDNSWNAIFSALKMFGAEGCHFYLLNVFKVSPINLSRTLGEERSGMLFDSAAKGSQEQLDRMLEYLKKHHQQSKHVFESISKFEDISKAVTETVKEKQIDLVVMGTNGATGAKAVFIGSTTVKVLKVMRSCPILVIPSAHDFKSLKHVVFPTDFKRFYNRSELVPLIDLILQWNSNIRIFHVAQELHLDEIQKYNKETLKKHFRDLQYTFHKVDIHTTVEDAISNFVEESNSDMVALIHYKHSFLQNLTQEPVIKKVAFHTKVPMLVLPELE